MENNKIFNLLDKAIQMLDRCWEGYKPVAGVKPYEAGSCEKEMATQSDMGEIEEVISMLDKAIKFYDPSQTRDESGKWSGSGGGSGKIGDPSNDDPYLGGGIPELLASAEKRLKSLKDKGEGYKAAVLEGQIDVLKSINERIKSKEKGLGVNFYDPSQARDESGRWAGGSGEYGSNKSGNSFVTDSQEQMLTSKEGAIKVIQDHHERALKNVTSEDEEPAVSDALDRVDSVMEAIDQARQDQPHKFYEILGRASNKISSISKGLSKSSSKEVSRNADYFETLADAINEIAEVYSNNTSDTWYRKGFEAIKKLDKLIEK